MKLMFFSASQKRNVSALSIATIVLLSFLLVSSNVLLEDRSQVCIDEDFSPESLSTLKSSNDLSGTAFGFLKKERLSSSGLSSYALTSYPTLHLFIHFFKGELHLCSSNNYSSPQADLIDQINHLISALTAFHFEKSFTHALIFNQKIIT